MNPLNSPSGYATGQTRFRASKYTNNAFAAAGGTYSAVPYPLAAFGRKGAREGGKAGRRGKWRGRGGEGKG